MSPEKRLADTRIAKLLATAQDLLGRYAAVSYAQRIIGQDETGSLTPLHVELINAMNADNFIRFFRNFVQAHVAQLNATDKKKASILEALMEDSLFTGEKEK